MLLLAALAVIGGFALPSSWAYRRGGAYLVASAAAALLLIACGALVLGARYDVPSTSRLMIYMLGFVGPVVVVPTALLLMLQRSPEVSIAPSAVAALGAALGFVLGFIFVVFRYGNVILTHCWGRNAPIMMVDDGIGGIEGMGAPAASPVYALLRRGRDARMRRQDLRPIPPWVRSCPRGTVQP